ncbi:hypothetical protein LAU42_09150 [Macrococcus armenti]|uniref:hypothetical protein n=1 Tax=Macrococcus armenti TaxID=2875764 RepID=UPI001CD017C0|nr:hypothetical protein [Macrococcus armenti]UBH21931.1 hypothetical protein LAU42_09150 [Macrococcus armenti]
MKRFIFGLTTAAMLLTACGEESKYESEDAKLKEYTVNTAKAVRTYAFKALYGDEVDADKFIKADEYIEAFKNDINRDKLSNDKAVLYDDLLRGLRKYDKLADEAKKGDKAFERAANEEDDSADFLEIAEYYDETDDDNDFKELSEIK